MSDIRLAGREKQITVYRIKTPDLVMISVKELQNHG